MDSTVEGDTSAVVASSTPISLSTEFDTDGIQVIFESEKSETHFGTVSAWVKTEPLDDGYEQVVQETDSGIQNSYTQNITANASDCVHFQNVCLKKEPEESHQSSIYVSTNATESIFSRTSLPATNINNSLFPDQPIVPGVSYPAGVTSNTNFTRSRHLNDTNENANFDELLNRTERNCNLSTPVSNSSNIHNANKGPMDNMFPFWQPSIEKLRVTEPSGICKDLTFVPNFTPIKKTQTQISLERNSAKQSVIAMSQNPNIGKRKRGRPPGQKNKKQKIAQKKTYLETFPDNLHLLSHLCAEQSHANSFAGNPLLYDSPSVQNSYIMKSHNINVVTKKKDVRRNPKSRRKIVKDTPRFKKSISDIIPLLPQETHLRSNQTTFQNRHFVADEVTLALDKDPNNDSQALNIEVASKNMTTPCNSFDGNQNENIQIEKNSEPSQQDTLVEFNSNTPKTADVLCSPQNSIPTNDSYVCSSSDDEEPAVVYRIGDFETKNMYNNQVLEECLNGNNGSASNGKSAKGNLRNCSTESITYQFQTSEQILTAKHPTQGSENRREYEDNSNCISKNYIDVSSGKIWPNSYDWETFLFLFYTPNHEKYYVFDPKKPTVAHFPRDKIQNSLCIDINSDSSTPIRRDITNENSTNFEDSRLSNQNLNHSKFRNNIRNEYFDSTTNHSHSENHHHSTTQSQYKLFQLEIRNNNSNHRMLLSATTSRQSFDCDNFTLSYEPINAEEAEKILNFCKPVHDDTSGCSNILRIDDLTSKPQDSENFTICFWHAQLMQGNPDTNLANKSPGRAPITPDLLQSTHNSSVTLQVPCRRLLGLSDLPFNSVVNFVMRNEKIKFLAGMEVSGFSPDNANPHGIPQIHSLQRNYDIETNLAAQKSSDVSVNEPIIKELDEYPAFHRALSPLQNFPWEYEKSSTFETDNNDECVIINECRSTRENVVNLPHRLKTVFHSPFFPEVSQHNTSNNSQQLSYPSNSLQLPHSFQDDRLEYEANQRSNYITRSRNNSFNSPLSNSENQTMLFENTENIPVQEAVNTDDQLGNQIAEFNSSINAERDSNHPIIEYLGTDTNPNFPKKYLVQENMSADVIKYEYACTSEISPRNSLHPTAYIQSYVSPFQPEDSSPNSSAHHINETETHCQISDSHNFVSQLFPRSNEERMDFVSLGSNRIASQQIQMHRGDINFEPPAKIGILERYVNNFDKQQNSQVNIFPISSFAYNETGTMRTRRIGDREINPAYRFNSGGNIINQNVSFDSEYNGFNERLNAHNYTTQQEREPNSVSSPKYTTLRVADTLSAMNVPSSTFLSPLSTSQTTFKSQNYNFLGNINKDNKRVNNLYRNGVDAQTCRSDNYSPFATEMPIDLQISNNINSIRESRFVSSPKPNSYPFVYVGVQSSEQRVQPIGESELRRNSTNMHNNFLNSSRSDYRMGLERTIDSSLANSYSSTQSSAYNTPEPVDFTKQVDPDNVINRICINDSSREESSSENTHHVSEYRKTIEVEIEQAVLSKSESKLSCLLSDVERYADQAHCYRIKAHLAFLQGRYKDTLNIIEGCKGFPTELHKELQRLWSQAQKFLENQESSKSLKVKMDSHFPSTIFVDSSEVLSDSYQRDMFPTFETRVALASKTGLSEKQVNTWFKNRRQRDRRNAKEIPLSRKGGRKPRRPRTTGLDDPEGRNVKPSNPSMPVFPTTFEMDR